MSAALKHVRSHTVVLPAENVDTDQIIPARFLLVTERAGIGPGLFADWRYTAAGQPRPDFPLNRPAAQGAQVLVAGRNFGCGSSREHAAWALVQSGFRVVISTAFADIFKANALKNGLLPIVVQEDVHQVLIAAPGATVDVDVASTSLGLPDGRRVTFELDAFARHCLLEGVDELGFLLRQSPQIELFENRRQ